MQLFLFDCRLNYEMCLLTFACEVALAELVRREGNFVFVKTHQHFHCFCPFSDQIAPEILPTHLLCGNPGQLYCLGVFGAKVYLFSPVSLWFDFVFINYCFYSLS